MHRAEGEALSAEDGMRTNIADALSVLVVWGQWANKPKLDWKADR
jgi:hypothetical protein